MTSDRFRVICDGPAVEDGEMDVAQFASSLLALGKLIESADAIRTGDPGRVKIRVQADAKRGSFDVGIAVHWATGLGEAAIAWAEIPKHAGTLALLGLLGVSIKDVVLAGGKGVIQVARWLKGRRISRRVELRDGNTTLITDDGAELEVNPLVARMIEDPTIRVPLEKFTEPLREDGVDEIRLERDTAHVLERISAADASAFAAGASSEPTSSDTFRAIYQIKRLFFERGRKWRLSNGAQTITAEIDDDVFWAKVDSAEVWFSKEDYLICSVRMDQWLTASGLRTEYRVISVEEHIPAPREVGLPGV